MSLSTLTQAILAAGCAQRYSFAVVDPIDDISGGQPGGNIRNAFLYDPTVVRLRNSTGGPGNATLEEMVDAAGHLIYNPGFVYPNSSAWLASRRPLIAEWEFLNGGSTFITISTHWTSKGGGSSIQGDARPPVNGGIDQRTEQATETAVSLLFNPAEQNASAKFYSLTDSLSAIANCPCNPKRKLQLRHHRHGRLQRLRLCPSPDHFRQPVWNDQH